MNMKPGDVESKEACQATAAEEQMEVYVCLEVSPVYSGHGVSNLMDFLSTLDLSLRWDLAWLLLSERCTPFPDSVGRVKARIAMEQQTIAVWQGSDAETRRIPPSPSGPDRPDEGLEEDLDENAEAEGAAEGDELDRFLQWWSASSEGLESSTSSSGSSSSSSTSASRSSSASSRRDEVDEPLVPHIPEAPRVEAADEAAHRQRQHRPESFDWGPDALFHFAFKGPRTYEVCCKYHTFAKQRCTKTCSWDDVVCSRSEAIKRLKLWCLSAAAHPTKQSHQGARGAPRLTDAERELSDEQLDERLELLPAVP